MILALAQLNHPSYSPALWQGTMVYWGVMAVAIFFNTYAGKILPKLESFILVLHIAGFFAILIPLVSVGSWSVPSPIPRSNCNQMSSEKVSAHDVFTVFENGGDWPSTTVSVFVGLLGSVFATYGMTHSILNYDHDPTAYFKTFRYRLRCACKAPFWCI